MRSHKCARLFYIELDDYEDSTNNMFVVDTPAEPCISLQALTGLWSVRAAETMQVVFIGEERFTALMDTSSTHNFLSDDVLARVGLTPTATPSLHVMMANGDQVASGGACHVVPLRIGDLEFQVDCFTLPLGGDVVLGVQWLRTLGPILWDLDNLRMSFCAHGCTVSWTGLAAPQPRVLHAMTGHDSALMDDMLLEFDDIFAEPTSLPPMRRWDHRIRLHPDAPSVAVRP